MLHHQIQRVRKSVLIDKLIIATSKSKTDDPIEDFCLKIGTQCFREVLRRFKAIYQWLLNLILIIL